MKKFLILLALAFTFTACNNDDDNPSSDSSNDTTAPTLSTSISTDLTAAAGSNISVPVTITDNAGLSQVRIDVHHNFDGHSHKTLSVDTLAYQSTVNISGTSANHTFSIPTSADNQPGDYHINIYALDAQGNEAQFIVIDLTLTNNTFPQSSGLTYDGGAPSDEEDLNFGVGASLTRNLVATLTASGSATISEVHVVAIEEEGEGHGHSHGKTFDGDEEIEILHLDGLSAATYSLSQALTFNAADFEHDHHYALILEVEDSEGRKSTIEITELHVMKGL